MGKHQKLLQKLQRTPLPQDFKWRELTVLLEGFGFECKEGSGSRVKFIIPGDVTSLIMLHKPHPHPDVDRAALKEVLQKLDDMGLLK